MIYFFVTCKEEYEMSSVKSFQQFHTVMDSVYVCVCMFAVNVSAAQGQSQHLQESQKTSPGWQW